MYICIDIYYIYILYRYIYYIDIYCKDIYTLKALNPEPTPISKPFSATARAGTTKMRYVPRRSAFFFARARSFKN